LLKNSIFDAAREYSSGTIEQSPADLLAEDHTMRGDDPQQAAMFSDISPEERVPQEHPLRLIRALVDAVLKELSPQLDRLYSHTGRPSIAPEKWLRALLRQVLYTMRRERLLMEQLDDNLLFRWFVGLNMDDAIWDPTVVSKNRERLLAGEVAQAFFEQVLAPARERGLLSDDHFTGDGTLIAAWAGQQSFKRKESAPPSPPPDDPGNPSIDCRGERRINATPASTTEPAARLYTKATGQEAKRWYLGHVLMENRHGLVVETRVTQATGTAEREAALAMAEGIPGQPQVTLGADKGYDTRDFVHELRELRVTPHVAQHTTGRSSAIDGRTTCHPGYGVRQRKRTCVEEIFGWLQTVGLLRKTRPRGVARVGWMCTFRWVAEACCRVWMEASLGMPLWRTTTVQGFWRAVGDKGAEPSRAGNTQGRGRWRRQYARHNASPRGARCTKRSVPPVPWCTRPSIRCASMSETCSWVPAVSRSPQAYIIRRHLRAFGGSTKARRDRTSHRLNTTGSCGVFRGRTKSKTGHGRCSVRSEKNRIPSR
jgi:transposase